MVPTKLKLNTYREDRDSWAGCEDVSLGSGPLPWHVLAMCQKDRDSSGSSHELPLKPALRVIASSFLRRIGVSQTSASRHLRPPLLSQ